ncbi:hypothetical protein FH972_023767 [Carpinus fangiana]|uniref:Uncharacterized protein n=1 Tax=Carpinus fangiana TaxID=176857 RepID=A0A5N6KWX5_9ROSI|nr:hypothetical protein FH972_023767 [Carpinus fangiana]
MRPYHNLWERKRRSQVTPPQTVKRNPSSPYFSPQKGHRAPEHPLLTAPLPAHPRPLHRRPLPPPRRPDRPRRRQPHEPPPPAPWRALHARHPPRRQPLRRSARPRPGHQGALV